MSGRGIFRSPAVPWNDPAEMALWGIAALIGVFFAHNFVRHFHK